MATQSQLVVIQSALLLLLQFSLILKVLMFVKYKSPTWKFLYLIYFPQMHIIQTRDGERELVKKINNGLTATLLALVFLMGITYTL
jgi:hypothetical protein